MDTEEDTDFVTSEEMNLDPDDLVISSTSSNTEFCMVYDDDVMEDNPSNRDASVSRVESHVLADSADSNKHRSGVDLDVEAIKKKTDVCNHLGDFQIWIKILCLVFISRRLLVL